MIDGQILNNRDIKIWIHIEFQWQKCWISENLALQPTNAESILPKYNVSNLKYMYTFSLIGFYRANAEQWVDLETLEDLNIDSEKGIFLASIRSDRFKKMVKMSMVSNPAVTAVKSHCIWFVSHQVKSTLPCILHHLTLQWDLLVLWMRFRIKGGP